MSGLAALLPVALSRALLITSCLLLPTANASVVVEQWDFASNSRVGINGATFTFIDKNSNADEVGGAQDDTYTVGLFRLLTPLPLAA